MMTLAAPTRISDPNLSLMTVPDSSGPSFFGKLGNHTVKVIDWCVARTGEVKFYDKIIKFTVALFCVFNPSANKFDNYNIDHFIYARGMIKFLDPLKGAAWFIKNRNNLFDTKTKILETVKITFALISDSAVSAYFICVSFIKDAASVSSVLGNIAKYCGLGFLSLDLVHSCIKVYEIYKGKSNEQLSLVLLNIAVRFIEVGALVTAIILPLTLPATAPALPIVLVILAAVAASAGLTQYFVQTLVKKPPPPPTLPRPVPALT